MKSKQSKDKHPKKLRIVRKTVTEKNIPLNGLHKIHDDFLKLLHEHDEILETKMFAIMEKMANAKTAKQYLLLEKRREHLAILLTLYRMATWNTSMNKALLGAIQGVPNKEAFEAVKQLVESQDAKVAETLIPIKKAFDAAKEQGKRNDEIYG